MRPQITIARSATLGGREGQRVTRWEAVDLPDGAVLIPRRDLRPQDVVAWKGDLVTISEVHPLNGGKSVGLVYQGLIPLYVANAGYLAALVSPLTEEASCGHCSAPVLISRCGAVTSEPDGYDGITDDGEPCCADCWCVYCRIGHRDAIERDACEMGGPLQTGDPECYVDPDEAHDVRTGR